MKIIINPLPLTHSEEPLPAGWQYIRQPGPRSGLGISILAGLALAILASALVSLETWLLPAAQANPDETVPWWIVIPGVLASIVAHELLHLLWHPGWGLSARSLVLVWPRKFQFGVSYAAFMSRARWLVMRLSPAVGLTLLPMLALFAAHPLGMRFFWQQFLVLVVLVNSLGAGADLAASWIVARQVPPGGNIGSWNGRACWRGT